MKPCPECGGTYRRSDQTDTRLCARCWQKAGELAAWREQRRWYLKRVSGAGGQPLAASAGAPAPAPDVRLPIPDTPPRCPAHPLEPKWECRGCEEAADRDDADRIARGGAA